MVNDVRYLERARSLWIEWLEKILWWRRDLQCQVEQLEWKN